MFAQLEKLGKYLGQIAHRQLQAGRLQMGQGLVLGRIAPIARGGLFGSPWGGSGGWSFSKEIH